MDSMLRVENVTKVFGNDKEKQLTAVDHVSFSLERGESLGIVGESGSGKSTLVKLLMRLLDLTEGRIELNGKDITRVKGKELRDVYREIQMVFQNPVGSFDPRKTLGEGIGESLRNKGIPKAERRRVTEELLERCGLEAAFADRYPHEVSGGQCQRAAIARALAIEPGILVCDEATSALDVTVQKQVMELLQTLREERTLSYLFICHNLALVQSFCDRVIVMKDGKIVEEGPTDEVIRNPKSAYTRLLIESSL